MKFHIMIYGCQMNYADSARIKAVLQNIGFEYVDSILEADIVIFDTCSVRQKSEDKILGIIKDIPKDKKIWITGCMIQHDLKASNYFYIPKDKIKKGNFFEAIKDENAQIIGLKKPNDKDKILIQTQDDLKNYVFVNYSFVPIYNNILKKHSNLELLFRIDDLIYLPKILENLGYKTLKQNNLMENYSSIIPDNSNLQFSSTQKTAFVPIQTGCSQFCSYCIVPYARGFEKNRLMDEIINEVKFHLKNGKQEIVLLGQIVNKHKEFYDILKEILKLDGLKWLRYTSPYPTFYSDEILALHENEPKLCPAIHVPLQSGSDAILKKMFRGYNGAQYKEFVEKVQKLKRDISLTTDIIVGFCDESDQDFQDTLDIVRLAKFDMIYMGIYSPRPGTYAAKNYTDNISPQLKHQRWDELNSLLIKTSYQNNQKEVGTKKEVLLIDAKDGMVFGYDEKLKNIIIPANEKIKIGDFVDVDIIRGENFKLYGEI